MNAKQRELQANWDKMMKEQAKPLTDKNKFGASRMRKKTINALSDVLARNSDRLPGNGAKANLDTIPLAVEPKKEPELKMSREEYEEREAKAKEVQHCVMPLHKGGYILVTDPDMVKQMGKKTA